MVASLPADEKPTAKFAIASKTTGSATLHRVAWTTLICAHKLRGCG